MPEDGIGTIEGTDTGTETPTDPTPIIGADGKFVENWQASLAEDIRDDPTLRSMKDVGSLAKSYVHAQRMIGKDKIAIPKENATDTEWEAFWQAGGRPDTAGDYNLTRPDDLPEECYDPELAKTAQEMFHKLGLSKKQADALFAWNNGQAVKGLTDLKAQEEREMHELVEGLHRDWGNAYEQNIHLGNIAVEQGTNGDDEFKARLTSKLGNDSDFIRFAANLGSKFAEHGVISQAQTGIPTPADLEAEINEFMMTPAFSNGTHPGHEAAVEKVIKMRARITGEKL